MRADGSEFPVEIAITRPEVPGRRSSPATCVTSPSAIATRQALRALADEQAALRRVATTVAREADQARLFPTSPRRSAACSARHGQHDALRARRHGGRRRRLEHRGRVRSVAAGDAGDARRVDGRRADPAQRACPARVDSYEGMEGSTAELLREPRAPLRGRRADQPRRASVGRRARLERRASAVPRGRRAAGGRLRRARRDGARQRRGARAARRIARPHRRGRRRRAAPDRAQPP